MQICTNTDVCGEGDRGLEARGRRGGRREGDVRNDSLFSITSTSLEANCPSSA